MTLFSALFFARQHSSINKGSSRLREPYMRVNQHQSRDNRLRELIKLVVLFGIAYAFGYQSRIILDHDIVSPVPPKPSTPHSTIASRYFSIEHDERNSFIPTKDPFLEPLDCLELLDSYRNKDLSQLKDHTVEHPYHKSYVRLTSTKISFYISTSDVKVDRMRVTVFDSGDYYETVMSSSMQTILLEESERLKSTNQQQKRPIMLDIGGNIGWFSLLAAAHDAEVFVFEPNVVNMVRFCESLVLNQWVSSSNPGANRVHPFLKGLSDKRAQHKMYKVDPENPGSFSFSKEAAEAGARLYGPTEVLEGEPMQLVTLDALAQDQGWISNNGENRDVRISILKIDVEGLELKVLQGARELLKSKKVKNIYLELKSDQKVEEWERIFSILIDDSGYKLHKLGDHTGPTDRLTDQYRNGKELASIIAKRRFENANVWLRLPE
ncbi:hypothetical protein ACHAXR_010415 [Thalassiosira sp. AJA248-18]